MERTIDLKHWHKVYREIREEIREMVDEAAKDAMESLRLNGLRIAGDDRAEALVAAIMYAVCASHPELNPGHSNDTDTGQDSIDTLTHAD